VSTEQRGCGGIGDADNPPECGARPAAPAFGVGDAAGEQEQQRGEIAEHQNDEWQWRPIRALCPSLVGERRAAWRGLVIEAHTCGPRGGSLRVSGFCLKNRRDGLSISSLANKEPRGVPIYLFSLAIDVNYEPRTE
jgi:hypothetical protein